MTTSLKARDDIHSPTNLNPENYEYLFSWDNQQPGALIGIAQSPAWAEWMAARAPIAIERSSSQCSHCGAHLRYVALLRHIPTGETIFVGETCLGNRFERSRAEFQSMRKAAQLDRQAHKIRDAWEEYQRANEADWEALRASENPFVVDVLRKGRQYGYLWDRQLSAIGDAVVRDARYAEAKAAEALLPEIPQVPVPYGKGLTITGKVLTLRTDQGDFGPQFKCLLLVTTDEGEYKLWGTVPKSVADVEKGQTITLVANVSRSDRDEAFGFYSRPRKASVVETGVAA
jgi:hypothetical protein